MDKQKLPMQIDIVDMIKYEIDDEAKGFLEEGWQKNYAKFRDLYPNVPKLALQNYLWLTCVSNMLTQNGRQLRKELAILEANAEYVAENSGLQKIADIYQTKEILLRIVNYLQQQTVHASADLMLANGMTDHLDEENAEALRHIQVEMQLKRLSETSDSPDII